jgi:hypothetical protein
LRARRNAGDGTAAAVRRASPLVEDGEAEDERFRSLGRKAARWAQDNLHRLASSRPDMAVLVNRAADNWRPLFAIADVVSGKWPMRVRKAAKGLVDQQEPQSLFEETIAAIKDILGERHEITSKEIVDRLIGNEGGPWAEWGQDRKPITQNALARLLRPHKVYPGDIGPEHARRKGYRRSQFEHLFEAYLKHSPPSRSDNCAAAQNADETVAFCEPQTRSPRSVCADDQCNNQNNDGHLRGCADARSGYRQEQDSLDNPDPLRRIA